MSRMNSLLRVVLQRYVSYCWGKEEMMRSLQRSIMATAISIISMWW